MNLDEALRIIYFADQRNPRRYCQAAMLLAHIAEAARDYVRAEAGHDEREQAFLIDMVQGTDVS